MATSFYHVYLKPKPGITEEQVKEQMNLAVDWYKYADYCWVVKSTSEAGKWQTRLKPLVEPGGNLLILGMDPATRQGWMAKGFWEWLTNARKPPAPKKT